MADGNIKVEVSTQAAQTELERLRAENAELKRDLQYAREGLTKGRSRMREDNERLVREVHTWNKAAETYAADAESLRAEVKALRELWDEAETENDSLRVEAPTPALRRAAERSIVAWTVVRGGVWDPNGLMDEHIDALRKALGPNATMKPLDAAVAAERDCRTCAHHTYASGGCVSALRCVGGDRYQPTQPRQLWGAAASKPAPF